MIILSPDPILITSLIEIIEFEIEQEKNAYDDHIANSEMREAEDVDDNIRHLGEIMAWLRVVREATNEQEVSGN